MSGQDVNKCLEKVKLSVLFVQKYFTVKASNTGTMDFKLNKIFHAILTIFEKYFFYSLREAAKKFFFF